MTATRLGWFVLTVAVLALGWTAATRSVDFPLYRQAGQAVLRGDVELYPAGLYTGADVPSHGYRYAPALAFLFTPFALMPLRLAAAVFFLLKVTALVALTRLLARHLGARASAYRLGVLASLATGGYLVEEFRYGNFHFLMVALVTWAAIAVERGQVRGPAAALAVAIGAKLTPVAILGYWLVRRRVAACAATVAALLVLAWAPATVVGWDDNTHLLEGFGRYAVQKAEEGRNHSLRGALVKHLTSSLDGTPYPGARLLTLDATTVDVLWALMVACLGVAVLVTLWRGARGATPRSLPLGAASSGNGRDESMLGELPTLGSHAMSDHEPTRQPATETHRTRLLELSLVLTMMLLASPHTQRQYLVSLFVPVFVLVQIASSDGPRNSRRMAWWAVGGVGAAGTVLPLVFGGRRLALAYEGWSPHTLATLVVFVVLLALLARARAPGRPT